jgi:hypothetical protein
MFVTIKSQRALDFWCVTLKWIPMELNEYLKFRTYFNASVGVVEVNELYFQWMLLLQQTAVIKNHTWSQDAHRNYGTSYGLSAKVVRLLFNFKKFESLTFPLQITYGHIYIYMYVYIYIYLRTYDLNIVPRDERNSGPLGEAARFKFLVFLTLRKLNFFLDQFKTSISKHTWGVWFWRLTVGCVLKQVVHCPIILTRVLMTIKKSGKRK